MEQLRRDAADAEFSAVSVCHAAANGHSKRNDKSLSNSAMLASFWPESLVRLPDELAGSQRRQSTHWTGSL
jgi:hypothetical protein